MRVLDLCCGAGGASAGIAAAGHIVIGIDLAPQPHYPFEFHQADALTYDLSGFDAYWASPPCQHYSQMLNHGLTDRARHPDLIAPIRERLQATGKPFVIENVANAPLLSPLMLCGEMFGLRVQRHRYFEIWPRQLTAPAHLPHRGRGLRKRGQTAYYYRVYGHEVGTRAEWSAAMGIDWMTKAELAQAIPPAFSRWIMTNIATVAR